MKLDMLQNRNIPLLPLLQDMMKGTKPTTGQDTQKKKNYNI